MANKLYTEDIDKTVDWGSAGPEGLPVSGEKVQKFIKDTLDSKWGYLYYDKQNTNKYYVFSDEADFNKWVENPSDNQILVKATFDAPAPATVIITADGTGGTSSKINTILFEDIANTKISFKYRITDSTGNPLDENSVSIAVSITNSNGVKSMPTQTVLASNNFVDVDKNLRYTINDISNYLNEGTNTIRVTVTSTSTNVSSTAVFQYQVMNLIIESDFTAKNVNLDDESGIFSFRVIGKGTGQKFLRMFIGNSDNSTLTNICSSIVGTPADEDANLYMGSNNPQEFNVNIQWADEDGERFSWATTGKHSLQMYFFIESNGEVIKSQTLYYEFVLTDSTLAHNSYILFNRVLDQGQLVDKNNKLQINVNQYDTMSIDYSVYDSRNSGNVNNNSAIGIELSLNKVEGSKTTELYSTQASVPSGGNSSFSYQVNTYTEGNDYMTLVIHNTMTNSNNDPCGETVTVFINSIKAPYQIGDRYGKNLVLELSAKNRSNNEPIDTRNTWNYVYHYEGTSLTETYKAEFNDKVLWNDNQNGWINNCLVLNNGATVTVNFDIFAAWANSNGLTFEIDFETANVQNDEAYIMKYGSVDETGNFSSSYISIQACKATLSSSNGTTLETNYKDGSRQKIQFIFNPNANISESTESPYLMYLVVNGILDRAALFSASDSVDNTAGLKSFTIGNTEGEVTTKIHSIRIYNRALTLDQCVDNFIADSDNIIDTYKKNNIFAELEGGATSTEIDITKIKNTLPTMIIYGNPMDSIVKVFDKKANVPVDILYTDPDNPEFNFFALNVWLSNQGTSSMNYPRRNFRSYFNKEADTKTLRGYAPKDKYGYETRVYQGLTDLNMIARIQAGDPTLNLDKIVVNDVTYIPACNKKTLKKKFKPIDKTPAGYNMARNLWHGRFKVLVSEADVNALDDATKAKVSKLLKSAKNGYQEIKKDLNGVIGYGLQLYSNAGYARFKSKDMYTDRWTLKCDYAESSMTHNAGIGRLWGDVMRNVDLGTAGFVYETEFDQDGNPVEKRIAIPNACSTKAQRLVDEYVATKPEGYVYGDIRTSCDGKPIVIFNYAREKDDDGAYTGDFGEIQFLGLYNIMTDKGSTPLFGFETLRKDEIDESTKSDTLFDASKVECWECLQNGSQIAQMSDIVTDSPSLDGATVAWTTEYKDGEAVKETGSDNKNRLIFVSYEARWPDNDDLNETHTNNLETVIRFVNYCIPSVTVEVDGKNGYNLVDFTEISDEDAEILAEYIGRQRKSLTAEDIEILSPILNLGVSTPEEIEDLLNSDAYLNNSTDVVPNNTLYIKVPGKSYKNKSDKFYYTYNKDDESKTYTKDGDTILYDDKTDRVVYIGVSSQTVEEMNQLKSLAGKSIYYYQTYKSQDVANSSFDPLYSADDSIDSKVAAIINQLSSDAPSVYVQEDDESKIEYIEQSYISDSGYDWCRFDSSYDRTKVTKEINNTTIGPDGVLTARVATFDAKRWRLNPDTLERIEAVDRDDYNDLLTTVYVTKESNKFMYINEFGQKVQVPAQFEVKEEGYANTRLYDYFKEKKYEHFDIWKLAAYYIYFIRFAAVDQVIKNTMMTTEDGRHYYFINYDNDTINGVRNDGYLIYNWDVTRETYDFAVGSYAYAGFGSGLWNLLEQDDDFMEKVQTVANAMVDSGVLNYRIAINMFNVLQAGTWGQRLYNKSEQFKYIDTFTENNEFTNTRYLPFLQGSRASHREWWLRHRFDLYDSMWKAGEFNQNRLAFYMGMDASASNVKPFMKVTAGSKFHFCVMANNKQLGNNFVELNANESYEFNTSETLIIGNPLMFLGITKVKSLDFTKYRESLGRLLFEFDDENDVSLMTELLIGGEKSANSDQLPCSMNQITGLQKLKALEVLDIRTCNAFTEEPNISTLGNLRKFLAYESNIKTFIPYKGLIFDEVSLPTTLTTLNIDSCTFNEVDGESGFKYSPNSALSSINIIDCKGIDLVEFLITWYSDIVSIPGINMQKYNCTLAFDEITIPKEVEINGEVISGIKWLNNLRTEFGVDTSGKARFNITKGVINVLGSGANDSLTEEEYQSLREAWGDEFFEPTGAYFDGASAAFISFIPKDKDAWSISSTSDTEIYGNLIAGQHMDIKITMFPVNNDRKITVTPFRLTNTGGTQKWDKDATGTWNYNYNQINGKSYIKTDLQGNIGIDLYYYETLPENNNQLWFMIQSDQESDTNFVNTIKITIDKIIRPGRLTFRNQNDAIVTAETINTTDNYVYDLVFTNANTNLKINNPSVVFDGTDSNENPDYGLLNVEYSEEKGLYQLIYTPKITKLDTSIKAYVNVPFIAGTNEVSNMNINVADRLTLNIDTINIDKLDISYIKGEDVQLLEDSTEVVEDITYNVITFENTVNSLSGNLKYDFKVGLLDERGTRNYNVAIKNMTMVADGFAVTPVFTKSNGVITNFSFTITPNRSGSTYISGEFNGTFIIELTDEFDNVIYTKFNYKVRCYLPDKIKVVKIKNLSYTEDLTTDLLKTDSGDINRAVATYEGYICSIVNNKDLIWGDEENGISSDYLPASSTISSYTKLKLNEVGNDGKLALLEGNSVSSELVNYKFNYQLKLLAEPEYVQTNVYFSGSVTVGTNVSTLTEGNSQHFGLSLSPASATNWDYSNLTISETVSQNIYFIDKNGRFYKTKEDLGMAQSLWDDQEVSNNILFIGYLYNDSSSKKLVVFDPWLLFNKPKCQWYSSGSKFYGDINYGESFILNNNEGIYLNRLARYKFKSNDIKIYDNGLRITENQLFSLMYDYYRIVSATANDAANGGQWFVTTVNPDNNEEIVWSDSTDINRNVDKLLVYLNDHLNAELNIVPISEIKFNENDMIFFIYDYYSKFRINKAGRLLDHNEISILIQNNDAILVYIKELFGSSLIEAYQNAVEDGSLNNLIFDADKYGYKTRGIGDREYGYDEYCTDTPNDTVGKFFWNLHCNDNSGGANSTRMPTTYATECEITEGDTNGGYRFGDLVIELNDPLSYTDKLGAAFSKLYCIFGPQI